MESEWKLLYESYGVDTEKKNPPGGWLFARQTGTQPDRYEMAGIWQSYDDDTRKTTYIVQTWTATDDPTHPDVMIPDNRDPEQWRTMPFAERAQVVWLYVITPNHPSDDVPSTLFPHAYPQFWSLMKN